MCRPAEPSTGPDADSPPGPQKTTETHHKVTACYRGRVAEITANPTTDLITTLEDSGFDVPYSCREGVCTACVALLQDGEINAGTNDVLAPVDEDAGYFLACISTPRSAQVTFTFDE